MWIEVQTLEGLEKNAKVGDGKLALLKWITIIKQMTYINWSILLELKAIHFIIGLRIGKSEPEEPGNVFGHDQ